MKRLTVGLAVIFLSSLAAVGQASAEMLSLDCANTGAGGDFMYKVWVDMDKSSVTMQFVNGHGADTPRSDSAKITALSISWREYFFDFSLNRTTGTLTAFGNNGALGPLQCVKGTSPFPTTMF